MPCCAPWPSRVTLIGCEPPPAYRSNLPYIYTYKPPATATLFTYRTPRECRRSPRRAATARGPACSRTRPPRWSTTSGGRASARTNAPGLSTPLPSTAVICAETSRNESRETRKSAADASRPPTSSASSSYTSNSCSWTGKKKEDEGKINNSCNHNRVMEIRRAAYNSRRNHSLSQYQAVKNLYL